MTRLALAFATALILASVPRIAAADDTEEPMRYPPSSVRPKLILGGVALGGLAYGVGFASAAGWPDAPGANQLKIPVAGPWLSLKYTGCAVDSPDCSTAWVVFRAIFTAIDGLTQIGALGLIGEGVFMTTEADAPKKKEASRFTLLPVPIVTPTQTGVGFVGTF